MKYLFILMLIVLFSCSPENKILDTQRHSWNYNNWKQEFKDRTLCNCLIKGYNNKEITNKIYDIDKSYYNPIAIVLFDSIIDGLLKNEILKMKKDSLLSINRVTETKAGKTVFEHCIKLYRSKKLDSIAKSESKQWRKIKNIDTLIIKKMPSY